MTFTWIVAFVMSAAMLAAQDRAREQKLQQAVDLIETKADLPRAIALLEDVARSPDRSLAADALLRIGECYRSMGDLPRARAAFQEILDKYADLPNVVTAARARLDTSDTPRTATGILNQQVWTGPKVDVTGTVSADGRYISAVDYETGDLALHDLTTGADRRLTHKGSWEQSADYAERSAVSRNGTEVAFTWFDSSKARYVLRALKVNEAASNSQLLLDNPEMVYVVPFDWSPDGTQIAIGIQRTDGTAQIGLLKRNGAVSILKSVDWRGPSKMAFSPDGQFLAYDLPAGDTVGQRDVFVMTIAGMPVESPAVRHPKDDVVVGWTPDGALLFASDRTGALALWQLPMSGGRPSGEPKWLRGVGAPNFTVLGLTSSGSLIYAPNASPVTVFTSEIDFQTGRALSPATQLVEAPSSRLPVWSPDGKRLAYLTRPYGRSDTMWVLTLDNHAVKHLPLHPAMSYMQFPTWSPDGSLTIEGRDLKGREGLYRVDVESGAVSPIVLAESNEPITQASWTPDGRSIVYKRVLFAPSTTREETQRHTVVIRDLSSGAERVLLTSPAIGRCSLSTDGTQLAYIERDDKRKSFSLKVIPVSGGEPRTLLEVTAPQMLGMLISWTPTGKVVFARQDSNQTPRTYWVISPSGGAATQLELSLKGNEGFISIHPDGRHIAYHMGEGRTEVWKLDNLFGSAKQRK